MPHALFEKTSELANEGRRRQAAPGAPKRLRIHDGLHLGWPTAIVVSGGWAVFCKFSCKRPWMKRMTRPTLQI